MNVKITVLLVTCMAAAAAAGCTAGLSPHVNPEPVPAITGAPSDPLSCTSEADCVPAQCCHPASCTLKTAAPDCSAKICPASCEGPIDCGAGSCGCVAGKCAVVPARAVSVKLEAIPQRYSPVMSSTPGIRLAPNVTGFIAADTDIERNESDVEWNPVTFEWNATYGSFLLWEAPDYSVHDIGNPVATDGRIYWTFTEKPASTREPVVITVTARDMTRRGAILGSSTVTLAWDGDTAVYVTEIT